MLTVDIYGILWLAVARATEALQLRIAGKAVWFEPLEDEDDEEAGYDWL